LKTSKIIGLLITIIQLTGTVAMVLGMYTMVSVFSTAIPQPGYLDAKLIISLSLVVDGDQEIASDFAELVIPAQSRIPVDLELSLSKAIAEEYLVKGVDVEWVIDMKVTTLCDLISFSNTMTMSGSAQ